MAFRHLASSPVTGQAVDNLVSRPSDGRRLIDYYDIEAFQQFFVLSERLSNHTLDFVTGSRFTAIFFGNRKAQAGGCSMVVSAQHGKPLVSATCRPFENSTEIGRIEQPVVFPKPVGAVSFQSEFELLTLTGVTALDGPGPSHVDASGRGGRPWLPYGHGNRVCVRALFCWADTYVSSA